MTIAENIEQLTTTPMPWLTDGGFETSLIFLDGFDLPLFAACVLADDEKRRQGVHTYFDRYLGVAEDIGTGFVLDTITWRAGVHWGAGLGRSEAEMVKLNHDAVDIAKSIRSRWQSRVNRVAINGVVGPAGDGYAPEEELAADAAKKTHLPQVKAFADAGVDMVSAITMTHSGEAIGIANAAREFGVPVVISFTVETDGNLPNGQPLGEAIAETDAATDNAPIYYMINCAHPDHFTDAVANGEGWLQRIGGIRANASRMSHAELDEAEELDDGNPQEFGVLHGDLARHLPNLRVIGGCCGTDDRHVGCAAHHVVKSPK